MKLRADKKRLFTWCVHFSCILSFYLVTFIQIYICLFYFFIKHWDFPSLRRPCGVLEMKSSAVFLSHFLLHYLNDAFFLLCEIKTTLRIKADLTRFYLRQHFRCLVDQQTDYVMSLCCGFNQHVKLFWKKNHTQQRNTLFGTIPSKWVPVSLNYLFPFWKCTPAQMTPLKTQTAEKPLRVGTSLKKYTCSHHRLIIRLCCKLVQFIKQLLQLNSVVIVVWITIT